MSADGVTNSYLIPIGDLSLAEKQSVRADADALLWDVCRRTLVRDNPADVIIRDAMPFTDFALNAQEDWLIAGAGVVGTELQYMSVLTPIDHIIAFYGLALETTPPIISRVRFTLGATSTTVRGFFDTQALNSRLEPAGYFSERIVFKPNETCRIMVMPKVAWAVNTQRLVLLARVMEPIGQNVSAPSI